MSALPLIIVGCENRWSIQVLDPFPSLSYHYVAPAIRADGTKAVLKIGKPNRELNCQIEALRLYKGRNVVRLLESDAAVGAMLLERATPGVMLSTLTERGDDIEATSIAAEMMRKMWQPAPDSHSFPTVAEWARGLSRLRLKYDGSTGPFPRHLVEAAESLFRDLLGSSTRNCLLHGDLHHFNILSAEHEPWLVIDPKGLVGDPGFEVGAFLQNPSLQSIATLKRRLSQMSECLSMDREWLHGWALAHGVLSAWWHIEDEGELPESSIEYCKRIAAIRWSP